MTKRLETLPLTRRDPALTILFYMTLAQTGISTVLALPGLQAPGPAAAAAVLGLTACGLAAHFALARAFARCAGLVARYAGAAL